MKVTLISSAILLLLYACVFWMLDPYHLGAPKDIELIEMFEKNRTVFEELHSMAEQEGEAIIVPSIPNNKISSFRKSQYDSLLSKIGNPTLILGENRIKWIYASGGMQSIGPTWTKGISFDVNCNKNELRRSLDLFPKPLEDQVYCRAIKGNWRINVTIWT